jgi:HEAT repeat protein
VQFWKQWFLARRPGQSPDQPRPFTPQREGSLPASSVDEARQALMQFFNAWELRRQHPLFTPGRKSRLVPGARASEPPQEAGLTLEYALQQISAPGPQVREPLIEVLRAASSDARAVERARLAALALGRMGALSALPALLEALRDQRADAAPLRAAAAAALGQIQAEAAAHLYAPGQPPHSSEEWRAAAEALHAFSLEPVIAALIEALRDSSPQVRAASAAAFLELVPDDLPNTWLFADLQASTAPPVPPQSPANRTALRAATGPLSQALKDPDPTVRLKAATSLGWLGDDRAADALADTLNDSDARCRSAAALALGILGAPAALKPLAHALADSSITARQSAAEALGQLANPVAAGLLLDVLHDAREPLEVRAAAARALGKLHFPQVVSPLRALLESPEPLLRAAASEALGSLGLKRTFQLLVPLLWRDPDRAVRHSAARALARLSGDRKRCTRWRLRLALRVEREVRQEALLILEQRRRP